MFLSFLLLFSFILLLNFPLDEYFKTFSVQYPSRILTYNKEDKIYKTNKIYLNMTQLFCFKSPTFSSSNNSQVFCKITVLWILKLLRVAFLRNTFGGTASAFIYFFHWIKVHFNLFFPLLCTFSVYFYLVNWIIVRRSSFKLIVFIAFVARWFFLDNFLLLLLQFLLHTSHDKGPYSKYVGRGAGGFLWGSWNILGIYWWAMKYF